jgi:hypothetical protein
VKGIATASLEFHLYREDFENWTKTTLKDEDFSSELGRIRQAGLKGEALRKEMVAVIEARFGL